MKVVILCGGSGSRIAQETKNMPKTMIKVGGKPLLLHIIEHYKKFGFEDFILACGYKFKVISNYLKKKRIGNVKAIYTGEKTLTGKRLFKLKKYLKNEEDFMLTYGDGISNINLNHLLKFHLKTKKVGTVTAVNLPSTFGELIMSKNNVKRFNEKKINKKSWINGGFFVFNKKVFNFLSSVDSMLEDQLMNSLVKNKQLVAFKHKGFWKCVDNYKDKIELEKLLKKKRK